LVLCRWDLACAEEKEFTEVFHQFRCSYLDRRYFKMKEIMWKYGSTYLINVSLSIIVTRQRQASCVMALGDTYLHK
jgi:hypothetical protein